jgi:hypothetical protein
MGFPTCLFASLSVIKAKFESAKVQKRTIKIIFVKN